MAGYKTPPGTIVNTIKSLLRERYKQGFPIIKEIIQNANDGCATTLDFGIVKGLGESVNHQLLKTPALFFLNNGTFSNSDKEGISCFGIDANAKDRGKIGKFGLGQKSIFHFCEAFFYIARSEDISEGCGEFINPWATPEGLDLRRPEWSELSQQDRQNLENYLIAQKLVKPENLRYFLLWIPLRQKMADERCILANYYDDAKSVRESLPDDMEMRIGQLLPLLRHIRHIKYWIENDSASLQKSFHVRFDDQSLLERCIYPNAKSETIEPDEHDLHGKVIVRSDQLRISFAGKERILAASDFSSLLGQNPLSVSSSFWKDLQKSSFWTERSSINEYGEEETVPDKSIPHCAVVFTKQALGNKLKARLILQWSVFLPLASKEKHSSTEETEQEACEEIDCEGDEDYTIFLHGYFFLDSGRKYIEGLQNIRNGVFVQQTPSNEDEMIAQWNYLLATKGTLKLLLPSLQHFSKTHSLSNRDISNLCQAILSSRLFKSEVYRHSICSQYQWVFRLKSSHSGWELIQVDASVRSLPAIPLNWQVFPKLRELAEHYYLILDNQPNLLSNEISLTWQEHEICAVFDSLNLSLVFSNSENINYLADFLIQQRRVVSQTKVQTSLTNLISQAFLTVDIQKLRQDKILVAIQKLVALISPEKRLAIAKFSAEEQAMQLVLRKLYTLNLNDLLLIHALFDSPLSPSCRTLDENQIISILTCLGELLKTEPSSRGVTREIIEQILAPIGSPEPIFNNLPNTPLFFGYNHRQEKIFIYTYLQLQEFRQKSLLFKGNLKTAIATALGEALPSCELIFIDDRLAKVLDKLPSLTSIPKCEPNSCLRLLSARPDLAISDKRTSLLRELINHV